MKKTILLLLFISLSSCSGMKKSEKKRLLRLNAYKEPIVRLEDQRLYEEQQIVLQPREKYPWELKKVGRYERITKEYFRCKGHSLNPQKVRNTSDHRSVYILDCGGVDKHSLPLRDGKEFVYPIFLELLNYLQDQTNQRVVITCAHRCPTHNAYADDSPKAMHSKHLIGAEVDFYVEGYEQRPEQIIRLLKQYYVLKEVYTNQKEYLNFVHEQLPTKEQKWKNKEICIHLHPVEENRDFDNRHPYPYLTIELLYDRDEKKAIHYNWQQAFNGFMRW